LKNRIRACLFLLIAFSNAAICKQFGGIYFGSNNLFQSKSNSYNISPQGISAGFMLPLPLFNRLQANYQVKACFHTVKHFNDPRFEHDLKYFFSASNAFLIGKNLKIQEKFNVLPQAGFGAVGEAAYYDWDKGVTHGSIFFEISTMATYKLNALQIGCMINFETDLPARVSSFLSDQRWSVALILLK